ncbi:uncharacterized protein ACRADG_004946 isoform 2-T2 [Cochliomyia hominivorax]
MDDKKLILQIKERNEIYNKRNPLYRSLDCRRKAWRQISHEMGVSVEDCMRRWSSLRDRYNKEYVKGDKTHEYCSGRSHIAQVFPLMEFIRPHISVRSPHRKNIVPFSLRRKPLPPSPLPEEDQLQSPSSREPSPENRQELTKIFDDPLDHPSPLRKICKVLTNPEVDNSFCEAVKLLEKDLTTDDTRSTNPAVYAFGEMIISTICSMNKRNQVKAMQQVTNIVMRTKLDEDVSV